MVRGHTSRIFASYAHELPYSEHFKGKKMKKVTFIPMRVGNLAAGRVFEGKMRGINPWRVSGFYAGL